jgi:hypothetical protein
LPVDEETLPVHLVSQEGQNTEMAVARLIAEKEALWKEYSGWLETLHPAIIEEFETMAQRLGRKPLIDFRPVVDKLGVAAVIEQVGWSRVIAEVGADRVIAELGEDKLMEWLSKLPPAKKREAKRRLEN